MFYELTTKGRYTSVLKRKILHVEGIAIQSFFFSLFYTETRYDNIYRGCQISYNTINYLNRIGHRLC